MDDPLSAAALAETVALLGIRLAPERAAALAGELAALAARLDAPGLQPDFQDEPLDYWARRR